MSVFVPLPPFPNVPNVPGVPPVPRSISFPTPNAATALLLADGQAVVAQLLGPSGSAAAKAQWGIFDQHGAQVGDPDNVMAVEYKLDYRVADYPIEDGGFESYNKVATPYDARVTMTRGGSDDDRTNFLTAIKAAVDSLDLYQVATPEIAYSNANLIHMDYHRTAKSGVSLMTVDVWVREVRVAASPAFSQTKKPEGAAAVNGGAVQAQAPTPAQASAAKPALTSGPPDNG